MSSVGILEDGGFFTRKRKHSWEKFEGEIDEESIFGYTELATYGTIE